MVTCSVTVPSSADTRGSSELRVAVIGAETAAPLAHVIRALPERSGLALVVLCHADPHVVDTLQPISAFPISEARGRIRLEADQIFVIPPDCEGAFRRDELVVARAAEPRAPIDKLLRSLADEHGAYGTGVILDGRGNDGVLGIKRLKEAGGLTIAQTPEGDTAEMPRSVIATGMIDLVLPLSAIGHRLVTFGRRLTDHIVPADDTERRAPDPSADTLHDILALLRIRSGHDFGSYKRATLARRVARRTQVCQCDSIAAYHRYLRDHPGELPHLLRDFLISVTNFFRDPEAFEALATQVVPKLFAGKAAGEQVRVWTAGCATGEEAYSIGMLLHEHARKLRDAPQVQIFATDIDEDSLVEARAGRYPNTISVDVTPERLQRFFIRDGDHYRVTKDLRETVLFSPHNLLRDPPFSRLDLISCRNLLIYLNRDAQDRVLNVFHFALRPDGFLFLGSSESAENTAVFSGFDVKHRLFVRRPSVSGNAGEAVVTTGRWVPHTPVVPAPAVVERVPVGELHHHLVERYAPPSVLVNDDLDIVHISERASSLLKMSGGEPTRQLLRLIHPALRIDLRAAIHAARHSGRGSTIRVVRFVENGTPRVIELRVGLADRPDVAGALLVLFDELDPSSGPGGAEHPANAGLEPVMHDLEEELRRTRDQLRATVEQYETSLEELKASNEELQAINEELRSATEELETSKEELQSVNEELTTLNHELNVKIDEVSQANSDLQNLMTSTDIGVVFLDRALNIKRFTPRAQDLFNVIPSDLGRPLAHLTHRLDTDDLAPLAYSVLQTLRTVEREVRGRDGRRYLARLLPYRSLEDRIGGVVLTFVEVSDLRDAVDAQRRSEAALHTSEEHLRLALRSAPILVVSQDDQLRTIWGYILGKEIAAGSSEFFALFAPGQAERYASIARGVRSGSSGQRAELELVIHGEPRIYDVRIERDELGINAVGFDITPSKLAEVSLLESDRRKNEFLATLSHELRNPLMPLRVALDLARLGAGDGATLARAHDVMDRQVVQLTQLVDELLDLSRITQGKIEIDRVAIDPVRVVEAALEATRPLIQQRNHQIAVELPPSPCRVLGDQMRLTQVLTNLLSNAAKYTPEHGHIGLSLGPDPTRGVLAIQVSDDGQGIRPEILPRIFEIFFQCRDTQNRSQGGLGIGLNLARRLVELHGGRLTASSAGPGLGSTFTVELPLAAAVNDLS